MDMDMEKVFGTLIVVCLLTLTTPQSIAQDFKTLPNDIDISGAPSGIVPMPDRADPIFKFFDRYTKVVTPNGKPIHIVVEPGYSDQQVIYARKVLVNHLTNLPGTKYGHNKATIGNAMSNADAILFLFNVNTVFSAREKD